MVFNLGPEAVAAVTQPTQPKQPQTPTSQASQASSASQARPAVVHRITGKPLFFWRLAPKTLSSAQVFWKVSLDVF